MTLFLGVDDAGRGPIIGPMVLGGVLIEKEEAEKLKRLGVADSKTLSPSRREKLLTDIRKAAVSCRTVQISAAEIDSRGENGLNLNDLEAVKMAEVINLITDGVKEEIEIFLDCPSVNCDAWRAYLLKHIKNLDNKKFRVEHKADSKYSACSAASILAKVTRDAEVAKIRKEIGIDFGSGYPADPKTKAFLAKYGEKFSDSGIIRKTWETWASLQKKQSQKKLF